MAFLRKMYREGEDGIRALGWSIFNSVVLRMSMRNSIM